MGLQVDLLRKRLAEREISIELTDAAVEAIADLGYDPVYGARPLKRVIQQQIENGLASRMLAGEFGVGDRVEVDYEGRSFTFGIRLQ